MLEIDFEAIATRAHKTAREKGWWDFRSDGTIIHKDPVELTMLLVEELGEIVSALRDSTHAIESIWYNNNPFVVPGMKPEGVAVEAGDFVIRVGDWIKSFAPERRLPTHLDTVDDKIGIYAYCAAPISAFSRVLHNLNNLLNICRDGRVQLGVHVPQASGDILFRTRLADELIASVRTVACLCHFYELPLADAINVKQDYNELRPYRHGNKRA